MYDIDKWFKAVSDEEGLNLNTDEEIAEYYKKLNTHVDGYEDDKKFLNKAERMINLAMENVKLTIIEHFLDGLTIGSPQEINSQPDNPK